MSWILGWDSYLLKVIDDHNNPISNIIRLICSGIHIPVLIFLLNDPILLLINMFGVGQDSSDKKMNATVPFLGITFSVCVLVASYTYIVFWMKIIYHIAKP